MIDPISHSTLFSASLLFPLLRASQFSRKHTHTDKEKERKKRPVAMEAAPFSFHPARCLLFCSWRNGLDLGPPFLACLVSPFSFFFLFFFWFFLALSCVWEATLRCLPSALSPDIYMKLKEKQRRQSYEHTKMRKMKNKNERSLERQKKRANR